MDEVCHFLCIICARVSLLQFLNLASEGRMTNLALDSIPWSPYISPAGYEDIFNYNIDHCGTVVIVIIIQTSLYCIWTKILTVTFQQGFIGTKESHLTFEDRRSWKSDVKPHFPPHRERRLHYNDQLMKAVYRNIWYYENRTKHANILWAGIQSLVMLLQAMRIVTNEP